MTDSGIPIRPEAKIASSNYLKLFNMDNLLHFFSYQMPVSVIRLLSRISDRKISNGFNICRQMQNFSALKGIKIAYPAGSQSLFGSSKGHMIGDYCGINIGMILSIIPFPSNMVIAANNEDHRSLD